MESSREPYVPPVSSGATDGTRSAMDPGASLAGPMAVGKADLGKRFLAAFIDGLIAGVIGSVIPIVGGIIGAAYMVARDGLDIEFMRRRSLGKKLMQLNVVRLDGKPMDIETSFRRNWMFGLGVLVTLLLYIPILGWALIPVVGLLSAAIGIYEIYKVMTDAEGRRWGDAMAGTKVIEVTE